MQHATSLFSHPIARSPVVVGLGGNLGPVQEHMRAAISALGERHPVLAVSALYRSAPIGPPQPDFLNAAVLLEHEGDLSALLHELQQLEQLAGRQRVQHWGPRTLDLDLLWAGARVARSSTLTVPHTALRVRRFALLPLLDLVPDARDPHDGTLYSSLVRALETQPIERLASAAQEWGPM